jgi:type VI secretion system protein VasD
MIPLVLRAEHACARRLQTLCRAALALALISGVGACGGSQARPSCDFVPETGNLTIEAGERLNPDEQGQPLPTIVRVYQLKGIGSLEPSAFDAIWRDAPTVLGDTLLSVDEVTLYPGDTIVRSFERNPEASFIVGMAVVRRPTGKSWRSIVRMPSSAAALQCMAQQADPGAETAAPPIPQVRFRVDDYQIRGSLRLLPAPTPACAATDLACLQQSAVDGAEALPETPELPAAPEAPAAPAPLPAP